MIQLSSYLGNPYIGVYCVASENLAIVPRDAPDQMVQEIGEALGADVVRASIGECTIIGTLVAMNSYGAAVSDFASSAEMKVFKGPMNVKRIKDRVNACGNNILVNDNAALVNPDIGKAAIKQIEEALQVEVVQGTIAGYNTVGAVCVATNKGLLCHPSTPKNEIEMLRSLFKVPAAIGTLNYGAPVVGACMVGNSKGAAVGFRSTPIELGRVEDALVL